MRRALVADATYLKRSLSFGCSAQHPFDMYRMYAPLTKGVHVIYWLRRMFFPSHKAEAGEGGMPTTDVV
jgi:hypothetical protein